MPNPPRPEPYFLAPGARVVRLLYADGNSTYEGLEPVWTPEKEAARQVVFLLAHPTGWGRNVEVSIEAPDTAELDPASQRCTLLGNFATNNEHFPGSQSPAERALGPEFVELTGVTGQPVAPNVVRFIATAVAGTHDFLTRTLSTNPLVVVSSGARNVRGLRLSLTPRVEDVRALKGRALPLKVTVNGALALEINPGLVGIDGFMPRVEEAVVPLDNLEATADLLHGELVQHLALFQCDGPGLPMGFELFYSSESSLYFRDAGREAQPEKLVWAPFGQGWGWTYGARVLKGAEYTQLDTGARSHSQVLVQDPRGRIHIFGKSNPAVAVYRGRVEGAWREWFDVPDAELTLTDTGAGYVLGSDPRSDFWRFDPDGRLVEMRSREYGRSLEIAYGASEIVVTDSSLRRATLTLAGDRIVSLTDPALRSWRFEYDGPSLTAVETPIGRLASFGYDFDRFVMTSKTNARGRTTTYEYVFGDGTSERRMWGSLRRSRTEDPHRGLVQHAFAYRNDPDHPQRTFTVEHTGPRGFRTVYEVVVDESSRAASLTVTRPDTARGVFAYDSRWVLTSATGPLGDSITASLAGRDGWPDVIDVPGSGYLRFIRPTPDDRRYGQTHDLRGNGERYEYADVGGALDRIAKYTRDVPFAGFAPMEVVYTWLGPGDLAEVRESSGEITRFEYGGPAGYRGLRTRMIRCVGSQQVQEKLVEFSALGQISRYATGSLAVAFEIDPLGRVTRETRTEGSGTQVRGQTLDLLNNVVRAEEMDGAVIERELDGDGFVVAETVTEPDGQAARTTYVLDAAGNPVQITTPDGGTIQAEYSPTDRLRRVVLPDQTVVELDYNLRGDVLEERRTPPGGPVAVTTNEVDARGAVTRIIQPDVPTPDGSGQTWRPTVTFEYFPNGRPRKIRQEAEPGVFTELEYELDGAGRPYLARRITPDGRFETTQPLDAFGRPMTTRGPLFVRTNPTIASNADVIPGEPRSGPYRRDFRYDCRDRLVEIRGGAGEPLAQFDYDEANRLTEVRAPDPGSGALLPAQTRTYDPEGRLTEVVEAGVGATAVRYETAAQAIERPGAGVERHEFDASDRPVVVRRTALGLPALESSYRYGPRGDLVGLEHRNVAPSGAASVQTTTLVCDSRGRVVEKTDPLGRTGRVAYDGFGSVSEITAHDGAGVRYTCDPHGRILTKTFLPSGARTTYAYDGLGNLTLAEDDVCLCRWRYQGARVVQREVTFKAAGVTKTLRYQYDTQGALAARTDGDGIKLRYRYDRDDRLIELFLNDEPNPIVRQDYTGQGAIHHRYLVRGGFTTTYAYGPGGVLAGVSHRNPLAAVASFEYVRRSDGRPSSRRRAGTLVNEARYEYDGFGRLRRQDLIDGQGAARVDELSVYDSIGNLTSLTRSGLPEAGTYDAANQLLRWDAIRLDLVPASSVGVTADSESDPSHAAAKAIDGDRRDTTDAAWVSAGGDVEHALVVALSTPATVNRIELQVPTAFGPAQGLALEARRVGGSAWEPLTPLTVDGGAVTGSRFDTSQGLVRVGFAATEVAAVRLVRAPGTGFGQAPSVADRTRLAVIHLELQSAQGGLSKIFRWTAAGACETAGPVSYEHDPEGRLTRVIGPGVDVTFAYGPDGRLARTSNAIDGRTTLHLWDGVQPCADYDGAGTPLRTYVTAPGQVLPFGFREGSGSAASLHFYLADERGSVVHVVRDTNLLENTYEYDAWGQPLEVDEAVPQPLRFMGQRLDAASGIYLWRSRAYDPQVRRFLEKDALSGSPNPYAFLDNDPATRLDPLGLGWWDDLVATAKELPGVLYEDFSSGAAAQRIRRFGTGFGQGVKAAVTGTVHAIAHPVETVQGVVNAVVNYDKVWEHLCEQGERLMWQASNDPEGFAEAVGRIVGEIEAGLVIGAGAEKAKALAKVGDFVASVQRRARVVRNSTQVPQWHPSPGPIRGPELQLDFPDPPKGVFAKLPGEIPPLPKHPRLPAHLQFQGRIKLARGQFRARPKDVLKVVRDVTDRRHLVADYTTRRILSFIANHVDDPIRVFQQMSEKLGYTFNSFNGHVGKVARKLQLNIFNEIRPGRSNVKVGPSAPNRELGRAIGEQVRDTRHADILARGVIDEF